MNDQATPQKESASLHNYLVSALDESNFLMLTNFTLRRVLLVMRDVLVSLLLDNDNTDFKTIDKATPGCLGRKRCEFRGKAGMKERKKHVSVHHETTRDQNIRIYLYPINCSCLPKGKLHEANVNSK